MQWSRGEAREELGTPQNLTQVTAGLGVPLPELRHTREGKMWGELEPIEFGICGA